MIMLQKVQEMLAEALNISVDKVSADAKIVEDLGADSLDVVELLSRLEDEFGITIPDEDVENLVTVGDVAAELEKLTK
ncbi:MAG: acyl carrier protein [Clostridiales bacterium]|nr:acyl carrier protein [Clostridiales bacterium]MBO5334580.1 acyl carrier protein [Clostridia bacterium]